MPEHTTTDSRFPGALYRRGGEPDPRFTLANERTFLAWIRTALALLAAGVALETLGLALHGGLRFVASVLFIGCGVLIPLAAWRRWYVTERSLREKRPLPAPVLTIPVGVVVAVAGAVVMLAIWFR